MRTSSKVETPGNPALADASAEEGKTSKHACWSGAHCSTGRFSLRRLFWRRSWNCGEGKTSSSTIV
jgi:hypothetical protein